MFKLRIAGLPLSLLIFQTVFLITFTQHVHDTNTIPATVADTNTTSQRGTLTAMSVVVAAFPSSAWLAEIV
jgi:hypothetical protein